MENYHDRKIWWIASYPKSGNTWLRMFLDSYVTGFPVDFYNAYKYVIGDLEKNTYQLTCARPLQQLNAYEQYMYYPAVLLNLLALQRTRDLCIKTHNAKCVVEGYPVIPPKITGGAIYLIRDPRDVAISYSKHLGISINKTITLMNDPGTSGVQLDTSLMHIMLTWSDHVRSWTIKNKDVNHMVIKYEDMLENTEELFRKVLKFMCIGDLDEDRFRFGMEQSSLSHLQKLEDEKGFPEKGKAASGRFFRKGKAGQWKTVLTKQQIERIEDNHEEMMDAFGYERSAVLV